MIQNQGLFDPRVRGRVAGVAWPEIPNPHAAAMLSLLFQFEYSQWLSPERLLALQLRQLDSLLRHAYATVPFHRERWTGIYDAAAPLTMERLRALPITRRGDVQSHFEAMSSTAIPSAHGATGTSQTSGSTGMPVKTVKTRLAMIFWGALSIRDHVWHRRDFSGKLGAIRHGVKTAASKSWGPPASLVFHTGPAATLAISAHVDEQLEWLQRQQPDQLITYPSNLAALAKRAVERGVRVPKLREVRAMGELLNPEVRELCREAWGAKVTDMYSTQEVGYIALQCPEHAHYHIQSETVLIEILDDDGQPCRPGETGRVVATPLHNFAMPLVRYEVGDYAEVGAPCPCGRGLPVLTRIVGRVRNMLVTASGERYWPTFGSRGFTEIAPVLQHQFVQKRFDLIEARLVTRSPLTAQQEDGLRRHVLSRLPPGFELKFVYCDKIPRSAGGKYEDFMSEVAAAATP